MTSPRRTFALVLLAPVAAHADDGDRPPTGFFALGAGYSSDEGFIAQARIGQSDLFRTGTGLYMDARISELGTRFGIDYVIPKLGDSGLDLGVGLLATTRQFPGFERDGAGGAITLGHRIDRATRIYVRYRIEDVQLTPGDNTFAARSTMPPDGHHLLAWAGTGIAYNTTDGEIPLRGTRLELLGEASGPEVGSDARLLRFTARADHATDFGPFTLRLHGHATYIHAPDGDGVPLSERLFHDGYSDIRGYPIYSIGSPLGENLEALGRAELELPVWRRVGLSVAGFYDVAYRYNEDASVGPVAGAMFRAAGASIIWRSPLGPLRFDWAVPLDGKDRERVFLFNLGTGF
jgi:outer membrane protein insertion porin family